MYDRYENEANHFENSVLAHTASTNPHPGVGVRKLEFSVQFSKANCPSLPACALLHTFNFTSY